VWWGFCGFYRQTDQYIAGGSVLWVLQADLQKKQRWLGVCGFYRQTDRYSGGGRWFVDLRDTLTDIVRVVVRFWVVQTD
jgi:hypothetical protein